MQRVSVPIFALVLVAGFAVAQTPDPDLIFGGARLGMSKRDVNRLPVFGEGGAGCGRLVLPDQPRTHVESCAGDTGATSPADGLHLQYLLAPDQEGALRVIHIQVKGEPRAADFAIDSLFRRFGAPAVVNTVRSPETIDRTLPKLGMGWQFGAQRVEFRRPCQTNGPLDGAFCVEWSDRPYARQLARSVATDRQAAAR